MKMMRSIEEYGKNLESLTVHDKQLVSQQNTIGKAKTQDPEKLNTGNQVNLMVSGSNSSLAAAIAH
jgi:hypothetical protein